MWFSHYTIPQFTGNYDVIDQLYAMWNSHLFSRGKRSLPHLVDDEFRQHCEVAAGPLTIVAAGDGEGNHVDVQLDLVANQQKAQKVMAEEYNICLVLVFSTPINQNYEPSTN